MILTELDLIGKPEGQVFQYNILIIGSAPIMDMSVTSRLKNWRTSPPKGHRLANRRAGWRTGSPLGTISHLTL